jgi:hypothetical protein
MQAGLLDLPKMKRMENKVLSELEIEGKYTYIIIATRAVTGSSLIAIACIRRLIGIQDRKVQSNETIPRGSYKGLDL